MDLIKIGIVDDQKLFRLTLVESLNAVENFELILEYSSGVDLLFDLRNGAKQPNVLLVDLSMPEINGYELNQVLVKEFPEIKVLLITAYSFERFVVKMIGEGVRGYLSKNCEPEELVEAINSIHNLGYYLNPASLRILQSGEKAGTISPKNVMGLTFSLTPREEEVLVLICKEYSNVDIAEQLSLSVRTIEGHRANLMEKTGCKNTVGLVLFAVKYKIFVPIV